MFKTALLSVLLLSTVVLSAEDSYVFEAKGKFAKDLKALVEKYSKDGKIDVKVIKTSNLKNKKSIIDTLLSKSNDTDLVLGKKIYDTNCYKCHGENANKNSYANSRLLSSLSKDELITQIENYKRDINYGGSTRYVMYNSVDYLSGKDIDSIASYIVNINNKTSKITNTTQTKSQTNEESSNYLQ